ncbi:hypothetical protein [Candidatus Clostridium radicumherbarum]|uniref:DUF3887 domain-containing protein n=1 Tax=Candidatus Clostridium radicumherbarum TaxID=3381662 RepID=A0ABW8TR13_9CLOT
MKKMIMLFIIVLISSPIVGCTKLCKDSVKIDKITQTTTQKTESDICKIAYNTLNETYKQQVGEWKTAKVEESILKGNEIYSSIGKYYSVNAYKVSFRNFKNGVLGPIVVYLDKDSYRFLGIGLRY